MVEFKAADLLRPDLVPSHIGRAFCLVPGSFLLPLFIPFLVVTGCNPLYHKQKADEEAYCLIDSYSKQVDGMPSTFDIERPESPYWNEAVADTTKTISLREAIRLAIENSREYRFEEELLFSQALALSTACHQFNPQYFGNDGGDDDNRVLNVRRVVDGDTGESSQVLSGFFSLGVNRMLETGTDISVALSTNAFRIISGDDPAKVLASALAASISKPLMRGAGRHIVRENLTQEERNMVYALRNFVRFRKEFTVNVAQSYYNVLRDLDRVSNAERNYRTRIYLKELNEGLLRGGRGRPFELDQAVQQELSSRSSWIGERLNYQNSLDTFKLLLGVPIESNIQPDPGALNLFLETGISPVSMPEEEAINRALANRLDLRNAYEEYEDARRQVCVNEEAFKPLLDFILSYEAASDGRTQSFDFLDGDKSYGIGLDLDLPLDTKEERNIFRQSLIDVAATHRAYVDQTELVRQEIRMILRSLRDAEENYAIQENSLLLAENRTKREPTLFEARRPGVTQRDVQEAQDDLLASQNALTSTAVVHFNAALDLFLAMEALRVGDDGFWLEELYQTANP